VVSAFASDGFLSTEISRFEQAIAARYLKKLRLAEDTNRLTHRIIYLVKPHSEHLPELMLASLLSREASSFQGFLILLNKGLVTQAQIILRNLAEMMFITGAIGKDKTFVDKYVSSEEITRAKTLEALVRDKQRRGEEVDEETKELIKGIRAKIQSEGLATFTTERVAAIAELSSYYDTLYRLTSMAAHASPRELSAALDIDSSGNVVSVSYEPIVDDLDMYLDYGISMMLYILHEVASHFTLDAVSDIEKLQQVNRELAGPCIA
jgi:Family of unknown function (DUF5677)